MSRRLLTYPELKELKGVDYTRQHLGRMEQKGLWPKRVQYGPGRIGWFEDEIDEHLSKQPRGPLPISRERPSRDAEQSA
jgi:prophage regulatory protein